MNYDRFHHLPLTGQHYTELPTAEPIFLHAPYTENPGGGQAAPPLRIAVPAPGTTPSFNGVFSLALTSALLDQSVLVICMTEPILANWRRRLQERSRPVEGLELLDGRCAWSANWRAIFCQRTCDVTVLHGVHSALREQSLPLSYARRLVDTVPFGLIVLA